MNNQTNLFIPPENSQPTEVYRSWLLQILQNRRKEGFWTVRRAV
ncbi:hypothetical protein NEF87_002100 [Candidatus Lokiarchaeum ossiferum]|uniref:Uncharacterized protein n=1 Tax=Candidatus Lokiarchaeum ossiferum TaxID=2951803 RepID=A0ABY6HQZ4_9ARCH|nr:hypothetical protein NEF87_002100 [Candidatus Lokiarchaeum sp. B-35]